MINNPTITVINGANKVSPTSPNFSIPSNTEFDAPMKEKSKTAGLFKAAAIGLASKAVSNALSRVGKRTGNELKQTQINNQLKVLNAASTLGMGYAVGNVAGLTIAAAKVAYDTALEYNDYVFEVTQTNIERDYLRNTQSYINSNNRNRGND